MAVKQNNTETNGAQSAVSGAANTGANSSPTVNTGSVGSVGGGTKTKKLNSVADSVVDQPGCSGSNTSMISKTSSNSSLTGSPIQASAQSVGGAGDVAMKPKPADLNNLLNLVEVVESKKQQILVQQSMLKIYHHIISELSRLQIPCKSPEDMKLFKEDIHKIGDFLSKSATERCLYMFYLRLVCQYITEPENGKPPSCALAVIFHLFDSDLISDAVNSMFTHNLSGVNIRKTVNTLCDWLRVCNFCQNLHIWILYIMRGLQERCYFSLFDDIASDNIEQLFQSLIVPVLRPKVQSIIFLMLTSVSETPYVFHKALLRFPRVLNYLKQQSESIEDYADETKNILLQLIELFGALMVRFPGYNDLYAPVEQLIKDYKSGVTIWNSFSYDCELLSNKNAKAGLVNLGNTCYMNSVFQALAMTKDFSREILLIETKSPLLIKVQQQIALMLFSRRCEIIPMRVLNATRPPGFVPGLQQDSSEFLGYLLETLHEQEVSHRQIKPICGAVPTAMEVERVDEGATALPKRDDSTSNDGEKDDDGEKIDDNSGDRLRHTHTAPPTSEAITATATKTEGSKSIPAPDEIAIDEASAGERAAEPEEDPAKKLALVVSKISNASSSILTTTIEKTFTGKLATTYKCLTCGWESRNIDSFRDLQLSFPEMKSECASNYSVQDLIDYFCSPEKLDGENQYFCERCKELSDAERYINVISAPKNLILTLKHFKYDQKYHTRAKLMHKVFHDEKVSVKVCSADSLDEVASVHYDLYAGVVHSGYSMDSGHYYTYAADEPNKWYKFNDSIVTPSNSEELHNLTPPNTPYILFYQMGAQSTESPGDTTASNKMIKVDKANPPKLEELSNELRDYVKRDNTVYREEVKLRHFRAAALRMATEAFEAGSTCDVSNTRNSYDDDDDPPSTGGGGGGGGGGCGGNTMNFNFNRYVY